jgi:hypothetical protein
MFTKPMKHNGQILAIKTGTMDEPGRAEFVPKAEFYTSLRQAFVSPIPDALQIEAMPKAKP